MNKSEFWSDSGGVNFQSLSVKDLLEARDLYHFHLLNKANVVGTAIGLYLIRDEDKWPTEEDPEPTSQRKGERRFDNSSVRPYSWPCVIVVVKEWIDEKRFGPGAGEVPLNQLVPKTLFLPDSRAVPVCIVAASPVAPTKRAPQWFWPETRIGGGFPVLVEHQGVERVASVGCLVSDGHSTYALTSGHVTGPAGTPVYTRFRGSRMEIGKASGKSLSRLPFSEVYPALPARRTFLNLDIGLIEVSNVNDWTSRAFGLPGAVGPIADLDETTMTLDLVEKAVYAYGGASGPLRGTIKGLFYRYKSVGGYDYVSDLLICPPEGEANTTAPGDSGTIWHVIEQPSRKDTSAAGGRKAPTWPVPTDVLRPLAIEWGGQAFAGAASGRASTYALATSLSNVCKFLDVEIVRDNDASARGYWGALGHYGIAAFAIGLVKDKKLKHLIEANLSNITFDVDALSAKTIKDKLKESTFVPLAMVPDYAWKSDPNNTNAGRGRAARGEEENANHYADIDEIWPGKGKSILRMCLDDEDNIDVDAWKAYYDANGHDDVRSRGLLPFRIWQFFDEMTEFVAQGDVKSFVAAAGILSHYAGDACQPLHASIYANGDKSRVTGQEWDSRKKKMVDAYVGKGVHTAYETKMLDRKSSELKIEVDAVIDRVDLRLDEIGTGKAAAAAAIKVMGRAIELIDPKTLCEAFEALDRKSNVAELDELWDQYGKKTAVTVCNGARLLAALWDGAWKNGKGNKIATNKLVELEPKALQKVYEKKGFLASYSLDEIAGHLNP